jgi:hypothetical protein
MDDNSSKTSRREADSGRSKLLALVETPIRFFALVLLVIEALMGALVVATSGAVQIILVVAMLALLAALVAIVARFAWTRPEALAGRRPPKPPVNLSTGMVNLLRAIDQAPDYPHAYASRLHYRQTPRTTPWEKTDAVTKAGWEKAAIYGCMFLVQVGYAEVRDSKVHITEIGEDVYRSLVGSSTVGGPREISEEELFYNQVDRT